MAERFQQSEFIKSNEISAFTFGDFLKIHEVGLDLPPRHPIEGSAEVHIFEDQIFSLLRTLPPLRQEELFVSFFTKKVEGFPNGQHFGRLMTELNNIPWFLSQEEPSPKNLQKLLDEHFDRLNLKPIPLRIIRDDWEIGFGIARQKRLRNHYCISAPLEEKYESMSYVMENVARKVADCSSRSEYFRVAFHFAGSLTNSAVEEKLLLNIPVLGAPHIDSTSASRDNARWITVEDLLLQYGNVKDNPWEVLFNGIYDKGYWYIGPVRGESVIFVPPIKK